VLPKLLNDLLPEFKIMIIYHHIKINRKKVKRKGIKKVMRKRIKKFKRKGAKKVKNRYKVKKLKKRKANQPIKI